MGSWARRALTRLHSAIRQSKIMHWLGALTFAQRVAAGFASTVLLAILIGIASLHALRSVVASNNVVAFNYAADVIVAKDLRTLVHQDVAVSRGFLLTRDRLFLEELRFLDSEFRNSIQKLKSRSHLAEDQPFFDAIERYRVLHQSILQKALLMRKRKRSATQVSRYFNDQVMPVFDRLEMSINAYVRHKERRLEEARQNSAAAYVRALRLIGVLTAAALALACALAFILTRTLSRLYRRLEHAVSTREEMLAVVSHDLRNPLTSIVLGLKLLLRDRSRATDPEAVRKIALTQLDAAERMNRLIENLLDFAQMEQGCFSVEKSEHPVAPLLEKAVNVVRPQAESRQIRIHQEVESGITSVWCDSERVLQVILNLLGNALKFTPKGGSISLQVQSRGREIVFQVRDTGTGIPNEHLPRIFDRFWRPRQSAKGAGLGLTIVKGIVEAHDGRVGVRSQPGSGSTFWFALPRPATQAREVFPEAAAMS